MKGLQIPKGISIRTGRGQSLSRLKQGIWTGIGQGIKAMAHFVSTRHVPPDSILDLMHHIQIPKGKTSERLMKYVSEVHVSGSANDKRKIFGRWIT